MKRIPKKERKKERGVMWIMEFRFCALAVALFLKSVIALEFKDITSEIFSDGRYSGIMAAFGDFNADKLTDLFCIQHGGKSLDILLSNSSQPYLGQTSLSCSFSNIITNVIPGDFNGDSMMDVLISLQEEGSNHVNVVFLWGNLNKINCSTEIAFNLSGQPFVLDYNDDMILDVMGEDENKKRCIWLSSDQRTFTKEYIFPNTTIHQPLRSPLSSAVVDVNDDMVSDIVITGEETLELWIKNGSKFHLQQMISYPKNVVVQGQSTFLDLNTNGILDHLMAVCYDRNCASSAIVIWDRKSNWITLLDSFTYENTTWGFHVPGGPPLDKAALAITLRSGDFNMDGYPDFIVVLQNKVKLQETRVVILENLPCSKCPFGQQLKIHWNIPGLSSMSDVQLVAFYDVFEDGIMDVLVSSKKNNEWKVEILKNLDTYDAYFIKVLVLSGLCYGNCASGHIPYGANQPGPIIRFNTTKPSGEAVICSAVQMSQSAHFPLHLPYTVFGLGQIPNFVDHLTVAIPEMIDGKIHKREWTQIIPNSQMVVIPYPPGNEKHWVNKLFLTPSHLVFLTCIALIGTCAFIALIIALLHWKERREDKKEKKQEAYRFHFDAM